MVKERWSVGEHCPARIMPVRLLSIIKPKNERKLGIAVLAKRRTIYNVD